VTGNEEQVLQGSWTVMRWCRHEGLVVVRTLYVSAGVGNIIW